MLANLFFFLAVQNLHLFDEGWLKKRIWEFWEKIRNFFSHFSCLPAAKQEDLHHILQLLFVLPDSEAYDHQIIIMCQNRQFIIMTFKSLSLVPTWVVCQFSYWSARPVWQESRQEMILKF